LTEGLGEFERCAVTLGGWRHVCTYRTGRRKVEACRAAPELWRLKPGRHGYELIQVGLYIEHLDTWHSHFGREQMLVLQSSLLRTDPVGQLRRFEAFVQLPQAPYGPIVADVTPHCGDRSAGEHEREGCGDPARRLAGVNADLRSRLEHFFKPFNQRLTATHGVIF